jgi:hypothetical protein
VSLHTYTHTHTHTEQIMSQLYGYLFVVLPYYAQPLPIVK